MRSNWSKKSLNRLLIGFILSLSLAGFKGFAEPSSTSATVDDKTFKEVASALRCPTCTGLSVIDSEAAFSVQIKDEVKRQLTLGKKSDEILQFFSDRYGPWILREPPTTGVNGLVWLIPILLLTLGPLLIWQFVWRENKKNPETPELSKIRSSDAIIADMKKEIREYKSQMTSAN